jgi:hypothetical protein
MRNYSTPESALNLEITKLAIFECIVAVALYVGIGLYLGSFKNLAIAVVFAPLMLFRTEASAVWGLGLFSKILWRMEPWPDWLKMPLALIFLPLIGVGIRVISTVYWAMRRPLYTLQETPHNWLRQTVCTDFAHVPEIVPLEAIRGDEFKVPTFARVIEALHYTNFSFKVLFTIALIPFVLIGWSPSLVYRISFKATSLVYAPLIWVAHVTLQNPLPLKARLERITKGELEKVRRGLSWIIFTAVIAKLLLVVGLIDRTYFESRFPSTRIASTIVIPDHWPWWQFSLTTDALLTFFLLFFADAAIARIENQHTWPENFVLNIVTSASFLRAVLSISTISYFFYIALLAAFPAVASRLPLH